MDMLSRDELLEALSAMGICLPSKTKLLDEALLKRLRQALNASQTFSKTVDKSPLNIKALSKWPGTSSLVKSISRGNPHESMASIQCGMTRGGRESGLSPFPDNVFMDLRRTILSLAESWDSKGIKRFILHDEHEKCAIMIRVVDVLKFTDGTPVILLIHQSVTGRSAFPCKHWVEDLQRTTYKGTLQLPQIPATELEQKLLTTLLAMNAEHIPTDYRVTTRRTEYDFCTSFFLPVGPLSFEDVGKLNADTGCVVCGEKIASRCSRCLSVSYCSSECQREDWPQHRATCRSLQGGTWHAVPFSLYLPGTEDMNSLQLNRFNFSKKNAISKRVNDPPPNRYGRAVFVIKFQISMETTGHFMLYDRHQTMRVYVLQEQDLDLFQKFKEEMEGPRGGYMGRKMYRWAKRTSDFELSVCLDREAPKQAW